MRWIAYPVVAGVGLVLCACSPSTPEATPVPQGPESSTPRVHGRHVPERKDDFAWENDRVAFRMYGPALEAGGEVSSGIDIWCKSTPRLVLDEWYASGDYHTNHGEGGDFYTVGPSRGCGGLAIWESGKLHPSRNWVGHRVLDQRADYLRFELTYAPWSVAGRTFEEAKVLSLRAGENMNQITSTISSSDGGPFRVAAGLVVRPGPGSEVELDRERGIVLVWGPEQPGIGHIGTGIVVAPNRIESMTTSEGHALVILEARSGEPFEYHAGGCWSQAPGFSTSADWKAHLVEYAQRHYPQQQ